MRREIDGREGERGSDCPRGSPCVLSPCLGCHGRFDATHGRVLKAHTGAFFQCKKERNAHTHSPTTTHHTTTQHQQHHTTHKHITHTSHIAILIEKREMKREREREKNVRRERDEKTEKERKFKKKEKEEEKNVKMQICCCRNFMRT